MAIPYHSLLASPPFKFLIGQEKKVFMVHSALLAHHSKPLGVLVNGGMSEAAESCAVLDDVDENTFVRFSQFAYTGDYIVASNTKPQSNEGDKSVEPEVEEADDGNFHPRSASKKSRKEKKQYSGWGSGLNEELSKKALLWEQFQALIPPPSTFPPSALETQQPSDQSTKALLAHARLYAFADKYDIEPLRKLSLHKLQSLLAGLHLRDEAVDDIVQLLRWTYLNTRDGGPPEGGVDELRSLTVHYAACEVEMLAKSEDFEALLEENGTLGRDVIKVLLRRLD